MHKMLYTTLITLMLPATLAWGQARDTLLNMVRTKPYFYNLIMDGDNRVLAGTSDGVMEIDGVAIHPYDSRKGYITTDANGSVVIDEVGIKYHSEKKYLNLLPYPEVNREQYYVITNDQLYISSGGRLYIFDLVRYKYSYPYHSIRTISKDFVGTYSGIYYKGKKLEAPISDFTDGYIRQYGNRAFICNYSIDVLEVDFLNTGTISTGVNHFKYKKNLFFRDIFPAPDSSHYFIAEEKKLLLTDYAFESDSILFSHDNSDSPITLITEYPWALFFTTGNEVYQLDYETGVITSVVVLNEPITAGIYHEQQLYLLTSNALYRFNSSQVLEKITNLVKAHSMVAISGSKLIISTDQGLFVFNIAGRTLSLIIRGVEFNRKALYKEDDLIYAGSVDGLYTIRVEDIPELVQSNILYEAEEQSSNKTILLLSLASLLILTLGGFNLRYRRKWKSAVEVIETMKEPTIEITREMIEGHIQNNLTRASLSMLMDDLNLGKSQLYHLLKPDRPGSIIQRLRLDLYREMREEGKTYTEIAEATGLSISYLKKLKM